MCEVLIVFSLFIKFFSIDITGKVIDANTALSVPYATISVLDKDEGVYADSLGKFSLKLLSATVNDTLLITCVGYRQYKIRIIEFLQSDRNIKLFSDSVTLKEIDVHAVKKKHKRLNTGFFDEKGRYGARFSLGVKVGVLIENTTGRDGILESAHFRFAPKNPFQPHQFRYIIRIHVWRGEPVGAPPSVDLLIKPLLVEINPGQKIVDVNLLPYSLPFPIEGIFIGYETIGYFKNNTYVNYFEKYQTVEPAVMRTKASHVRGYSFASIGKKGKWNSIGPTPFCLGVTALIEKL